jgi:hypothetical protein
VSRQQRRAAERATAKRESRRAAFDRVHGQILAGRTVRDLWLVYARERFESVGLDLEDDNVKMTVEHAFYTGVLSMFELLTRVAPDDVSEDVGVEMLERLREELEAYATRGRSNA